jgi:hypothetical protein
MGPIQKINYASEFNGYGPPLRAHHIESALVLNSISPPTNATLPPPPAKWQLPRRRRRRWPPLSHPSSSVPQRNAPAHSEPPTRRASRPAPPAPSRTRAGTEGRACWRRRPCPQARGARGSTRGSPRGWAARGSAARACRPASAPDSSPSTAVPSPRFSSFNSRLSPANRWLAFHLSRY